MNDIRGPLHMLGATLGFATLGVMVKLLDGVPSGQIVFWRSLVGLAVMLPMAARVPGAIAGVNHKALLLRGLFGTASMWAYFLAISRLNLGDAVLVAFTSPLVVAALAPRVTGEVPPPGLWRALLLGLVGVALVVEPTGRDIDTLGVVAALSTTVLAASAYLSVRVATRTDVRETIVLWFSAIAVVATLPSFWGGVVVPDARSAGLLLGVGLVGLTAQLLLTRAYTLGEAPRIALFSYATPVWAYALGVLVLAEPLGWRGLVGTAAVVGAGFLARR